MGYFFSWNIYIIVIVAIYSYALFNLYIGRKPRKYKYTLLVANLICLIGYILLLITIEDYNRVGIFILLVLLLAVIVIGIIGSFLYNESYAVDRTSIFVKQIKVFRIVMISLSTLIGLVIVGNQAYKLLTHQVLNINAADLMLVDEKRINECHISFHVSRRDDESYKFICKNSEIALIDTFEISIFIDGNLIYRKVDLKAIGVEAMTIMDSFNYQFEDGVNFKDFKSLRFEITPSLKPLMIFSEVSSSNYSGKSVTKPVWVKN